MYSDSFLGGREMEGNTADFDGSRRLSDQIGSVLLSNNNYLE